MPAPTHSRRRPCATATRLPGRGDASGPLKSRCSTETHRARGEGHLPLLGDCLEWSAHTFSPLTTTTHGERTSVRDIDSHIYIHACRHTHWRGHLSRRSSRRATCFWTDVSQSQALVLTPHHRRHERPTGCCARRRRLVRHGAERVRRCLCRECLQRGSGSSVCIMMREPLTWLTPSFSGTLCCLPLCPSTHTQRGTPREGVQRVQSRLHKARILTDELYV